MSDRRAIYKCNVCGTIFGFDEGKKFIVPKEELTAVILAENFNTSQSCSVSCVIAAHRSVRSRKNLLPP
jgi:hypothetical protein